MSGRWSSGPSSGPRGRPRGWGEPLQPPLSARPFPLGVEASGIWSGGAGGRRGAKPGPRGPKDSTGDGEDQGGRGTPELRQPAAGKALGGSTGQSPGPRRPCYLRGSPSRSCRRRLWHRRFRHRRRRRRRRRCRRRVPFAPRRRDDST